ncbi:sulfite exporter TauE/SafE family protein [Angustibacter sp. McL0619]|uniref:sulfite exporter TauE/SafE family protein n=1 Tax=Angustibacter sp. McL0619 TaxID=3415676 RepID=UPI003CF33CE9
MSWLDLPAGVGPGTVVLLLVAALVAGWVDAVAGGGGLIQLPALLIGLGPGTPAIYSLATNKLASICGTATSSITYYRRVKPDLRTALPMAGLAFGGALIGAAVASSLPSAWIKPIVIVALLAVLAYTLRHPDLGELTVLRHSGRRHHVTTGGIGFVIGVYDGAIGPGTGSFLVFALVGWVGYAFVEASAKAKITNFATNLGALVIFAPQGVVLWRLGLVMGLANLLGGYVGARTAVAQGARFVRVVFVVVSALLIVRLGYDVLAG